MDNQPSTVLQNTTNVYGDGTTLHTFFQPHKRPSNDDATRPLNKKPRIGVTTENREAESQSPVEGVVEEVRVPRTNVFNMLRNMYRVRNALVQPSIPTNRILESFVSSEKADTFHCHSVRDGVSVSPPYTCAFSNGSKRGKSALLAVAAEDGAVHILNTTRREDWDYEPQRTVFAAHCNAVFDLKWHPDDEYIATASGDQTIVISSVRHESRLATLAGHTQSVKCVAWEPENVNVLCSGGRDGTILLWDLRAGENWKTSTDHGELGPCLIIPHAHKDFGTRFTPNGRKVARSITSLVYAIGKPYSVISSGAFDGVLREWDIRLPGQKSKLPKRQTRPIQMSPLDPTIEFDSSSSRRARGVTSLSVGTGPTEGLLFALANDSSIHTFSTDTLTPLSSTFSHETMRTNSFYVKSAISPCGKWIVTGSSDRKAFLYDVSNASRNFEISSWEGKCSVVELGGNRSEVGAVDWGHDIFATCCDRAVKVWRPDIEIRRSCERDPQEQKWNWSWATSL
ncbi:WD40 repeat-like protein [Thelephora ganbajun]|uniref:WD40 repeat-like protein n=1 Tax=Thelephora ganbajun TaxID=370292 RepID=A0ACB6ZRE6_THEGA|nr:WD40 repeat-like protein [Thelephora ganbajun]